MVLSNASGAGFDFGDAGFIEDRLESGFDGECQGFLGQAMLFAGSRETGADDVEFAGGALYGASSLLWR